MLKKFIIWFWPILRQVLLMTLERQIQETLYGKPTPRKYGGYGSRATRTPDGGWPLGPKFPAAPPVKPPKPRFTEPITVYMDDKKEVDEILARLRDIEFDYNRAHVADFVELMNFVDPPTFSDNTWGWRDLSDCEVLIDPLQPEMWSLTLPRPVYLG